MKLFNSILRQADMMSAVKNTINQCKIAKSQCNNLHRIVAVMLCLITLGVGEMWGYSLNGKVYYYNAQGWDAPKHYIYGSGWANYETLIRVGTTPYWTKTHSNYNSVSGHLFIKGDYDWNNQTADIYADVSKTTVYVPQSTNNKCSVNTYTTVYTATADKTIYFDNTTFGFANVYFRCGFPGCSMADAMTKVAGTDNLYKFTIPDARPYEAFAIANNCSWTGLNSIYTVKTNDSYAVTKSTEHVKSNFTAETTYIYSSTSNTSDGCTYYKTTTLSGHTRKVTITAPTNGKITVSYIDESNSSQSFTSGNKSVAQTCIITVVAEPNSGYALSSLKVGNTNISSGGTYIVRSDVTVTASFVAEESHSVTVSYECGGTSIKSNVAQSVGVTTAASISAPSIDGYTFKNWTLGTGIANRSANTNANPISIVTKSSGTYTLTANYEVNACKLYKLSAAKNGTTTDKGAMTYDASKGAYYISIAPDATPYYFRFYYNSSEQYCSDWSSTSDTGAYSSGKEIKINDSEIDCNQSVGSWGDKPAMYVSGAKDVTVKIWFDYQNKKAWITEDTYAVTINNGDHGTVSPNGTKNIGGSGLSITVHPSDGYSLDKWNVTGGAKVSDANATTTTVTATATGTVTPTYKENSYTVTVRPNNSSLGKVKVGTNAAAASTTVTAKPATASAEIQAVAETGATFSSWATLPSGVTLVSGYTLSSNPIKINATAAQTITANFTETTYSVTLSNANITQGTVNTTSPVTVGAISAVQIKATAKTGYMFAGWNKTSGTGTVTYYTESGAADAEGSTKAITYVKVTGAVTLQATWTEDRTTGWYLAGTWNNGGNDDAGWTTEKKEFVKDAGQTAGSISHIRVTLTPNDFTNGILFVKLNEGSNYYGHWSTDDNNNLCTKDNNNTNIGFYSGNINFRISIPVKGQYDFQLNTSGTYPTLTVIYPAGNFIRGGFNGWGWDDELAGSGPWTASIPLGEDQSYTGDNGFKFVLNGDHYGNGGTIDASHKTASDCSTSGGNINFYTTMADSYTFTIAADKKSVTVTYPTIPAMTGTLSLSTTTGQNGAVKGSGSSSDPYIVIAGKTVKFSATHSSEPTADSHIKYQFLSGTDDNPATVVQTKAATETSPKDYSVTPAANSLGVKSLQVKSYYEYGPTGHTAQGAAVQSSVIYYKVVPAPEVTFTSDPEQFVEQGKQYTLTASATNISDGTASWEIKGTTTSYSTSVASTNTYTVTAATNNTTMLYYKAILTYGGYTWEKTLTLQPSKMITITVKVPSSVWTNIKFNPWGDDLLGGTDNRQASWLMDMTENGVQYKYFTYTFATKSAINFNIHNGTLSGENQTGNIENVSADACYEILAEKDNNNNNNRKYKKLDNCAQFYRIKSSDKQGRVTYSNVVTAVGDTMSYFADNSSPASLSLESYQGGWNKVKDLSNPSAAGVYVARLKAGDDIEGQAKYDGDYFIHTDAVYGQRNAWKNYPDMDEAARDSARLTYFEPNDNYPDELYNYYWCMWITSGKNVNAAVGNRFNMYLTNIIGALEPYTTNDGKIKSGSDQGANVRFGYNPTTNNFYRNFIGGSTLDSKFLTAYADNGLYKVTDEGTKGDQIKSDVYVKFDDLSDWIYQLDVYAVKSGESYPQVVVRSNYGQETPLFGEGVTQNILGSGTTDNDYYMRMIYDYKTNRIISAWLPNGNTVEESITLEGNLMITRKFNKDATSVVVANSKEVLQVKQIYTMIEFEQTDSEWSEAQAGPDGGFYYFWVSLPYDCYVGDIFGIPGYGESNTWVMQRYRGDLRAQNGWFLDTNSFWRNMRTTNIMKAGEGYVLAINKNKIKFNKIGDKSAVRLFFPSMYEYEYTIKPTAASNPTTVIPERTCTITRCGRTTEDSHWFVLGIPGFQKMKINSVADASTFDSEHHMTGTTSPNFFYEWTFESGKAKYTVRSAKDYEFRNTFAYMLQYAGTITWNTAYSEAQATLLDKYKAPQRTREAEAKREMNLTISKASNSEITDNTFITMTDGATTDFTFGSDIVKIASGDPLIYTMTQPVMVDDGEGGMMEYLTRMGGYSVPEQDIIIPVGVVVGDDANYTFSINRDELNGVVPILYDKTEERQQNLLFGDYTQTLAAGTYDKRFELHLQVTEPSETTDLGDARTADKLQTVQVGSQLFVSGFEGTAVVELYDALGKRLFAQPMMQGEAIDVPTTGVYVLRVNDTTQRVVIR